MTKFTIIGRLSGLNEYISSNRSNRYAGAKSKRDNQNIVIQAIREAKLSKVGKYPTRLKITWYEPNIKRDVDNITFAVKFILDALVETEILVDDSQKFVNGIEHEILVDKDNPRIEVEIL